MAINRTALAPTIYTAAVEDPVTPTMALGTNDGRAVIGFMSLASSRSVASVSITGGDTLSSVATPVTVDGFKRSAAAGLVTQSGDQTVTFDTDSPEFTENKWGEVVAYEGVGSIRSISIVSGVATTDPSATVTTVAGDKVVMLGISGGAGASLSAAGGATDFDGGSLDRICLEKDAVGTSTTINGTWSGASAWYAVVVVLAPTSAPPIEATFTEPLTPADATTATRTHTKDQPEAVTAAETTTASISSLPPGTFTSGIFARNGGEENSASTALTYVSVRHPTTGLQLSLRTGLSTSGTGQLVFTDPVMVAGTSYLVDWLEAGGHRGWDVQVAT